MNVFIIVGILLIALGTGIVGYGFSIVGILLTALGTGIMVYGQLAKSKVDNAEVS
jgi:predicted DNA binding CopG/RHH family protein